MLALPGEQHSADFAAAGSQRAFSTSLALDERTARCERVVSSCRLLGDLLHLISFAVLGGKLWKSKRVDGVSLKTQELYLLVFCTRYLDLFIVHPFYDSLTLYNTCMK